MIFAIFLIILILATAMAMGGVPAIFFDVPALLFVFGLTLGGLLVAHGPIPVIDLFLFVFNDKEEDQRQRRQLAAICDTGANLAFAGGLVGALIGLINILADLADPAGLGPALAVALLSTLYGICLAELIFVPIKRRLILSLLLDDPSNEVVNHFNYRPWPWLWFVVFAGAVFILIANFRT